MAVSLETVIFVVQTVFVCAALAAALVLVLVSRRSPRTVPLAIAAGLVGSALVVVTVSPVNTPQFTAIPLAALGVAVAVVGGDPLTRRVLEIATHGRVRETADGGIVVPQLAPDGQPMSPTTDVVLMRGGTTIGYLERVAASLAIVAGFPEALAVIVAIKGIGRFSELAAAEARERFIIGTLVSLLWACAAAAIVRLVVS